MSCRFGDHRFELRFWGRDIELERPEDAAAWAQLTDEERETVHSTALAALESVQAAQIREKNRMRQLRDGMRFHVGTALRDRAARVDVRPSPRLAPRSRSPRAHGTRSGPRRARAPTSSEDPEPDDVVRLAAASQRLWAHIRRREARQRLVAA